MTSYDKSVIKKCLTFQIYEKIWIELPEREREIVKVIAEGHNSIKEIREIVNITSSDMSSYRNRLNKKGFIDISQRGKITFILPRFEDIIQTY